MGEAALPTAKPWTDPPVESATDTGSAKIYGEGGHTVREEVDRQPKRNAVTLIFANGIVVSAESEKATLVELKAWPKHRPGARRLDGAAALNRRVTPFAAVRRRRIFALAQVLIDDRRLDGALVLPEKFEHRIRLHGAEAAQPLEDFARDNGANRLA